MVTDYFPEWICAVLALCLIGGLVLLYSEAVIAFRDRLPQPVSKLLGVLLLASMLLLPMAMLALINLSPYYH
jgi:hypothetical protein